MQLARRDERKWAEGLASRECSQKRDESVERYGKSVTDSRAFYVVDIRAAWGSRWAAFAPDVAQECTWQMCQMWICGEPPDLASLHL